jgi:H+/gluconate symporter-like permease
MLAFGLWWLRRVDAAAHSAGEGFKEAPAITSPQTGEDQVSRERAALASAFDPAELAHGRPSRDRPPIAIAVLPLAVVIAANFLMSMVVLPRLDTTFLAKEQWGSTSLSGVGGVWAVVVALALAIATLIIANRGRLPALRESMDAGANASVLPALSVASLVGFGAVVAALPAFSLVRDVVLSIEGGPLVSLALATNALAALTGSASGGLTIALEALGETYLNLASSAGIDPALMHRVAVIASGTLDSLPHNGAVVTLFAVCGTTHRESYRDLFVVAVIGAVIALAVVIALGTAFGSF